MDQLTFQYPIWYLMLCIALGLAFATALYFRDKTYEDQPAWLKYLMAFLRFLGVALLSSLLLSPLLKLITNEVQEPIIVFAQDMSSSAIEGLSESDSALYVQSAQAMLTQLEEKFNVQKIGFGSEVSSNLKWQFQDQVTDIDQAVQYISDNYGDQNLGAVILASDGIYNRGKNPIYSSLEIKSPIFTIGQGDTTQRTDLFVKHVYHNKISFLGDKFIIQADVAGNHVKGKNASITLQRIENGKAIDLQRLPLRIDTDPYFQTQEFTIEASAPGVQRYRIRVTGLQDEISYNNNSKDIFIEVIDGRLKILILGDHPHPDLAAIKSVLELNENYEVEIAMAESFSKPIKDYNLAILHQIPGKHSSGNSIISQLNANKIPRVFILGSQSNLSAFNTAQSFLTIQGANRSANEVQAILNQNFNAFTISQELVKQIPKFVPALAPFGQYQVSPSGQVLAWQKIGSVETTYPLIVMGEENGIRTSIITAEGLWKWKLYDYLQNESHDHISELVSKITQYATVKDDKRKFRSSPNQNIFMDNEDIIFEAELYNSSYELVNDPDVFLVVTDESKNESNYTFNRTGNIYEINIGRFSDGNYRYTAYVDTDGQRQTANGRFSVQPIQLEQYDMVANHEVLHQLSSQHAGKLYYPNQMDELQSTILDSETIKPIMYQKINTQSIIHLKWIFGLLLILICSEWFLRRFYGGY